MLQTIRRAYIIGSIHTVFWIYRRQGFDPIIIAPERFFINFGWNRFCGISEELDLDLKIAFVIMPISRHLGYFEALSGPR